jgi:competence protein ComEC
MVVQARRSSLLINSGTGNAGVYTVVPFLRQAGINHLSTAVDWANSDADSWDTVGAKTPIQDFWVRNAPDFSLEYVRHTHRLTPSQTIPMGGQTLEWLGANIPVARLHLLGGRPWLMVSGLTPQGEQQLLPQSNLASEVLWWDGGSISEEFLAAVAPQVAIASARYIDDATEQALNRRGVHVFCTERDGAVTWNRRQGYRAYLQHPHRSVAHFG